MRQHFLHLSRSSKPESSVTQGKLSLIEMGGSRKRKREEFHRTEKTPKSSFDTPIPNVEVAVVSGNSKNDDTESAYPGKRKSGPLPDEPLSKQLKNCNNKGKFKKNNNKNNRY